jgi:ribonuclease HII
MWRIVESQWLSLNERNNMASESRRLLKRHYKERKAAENSVRKLRKWQRQSAKAAKTMREISAASIMAKISIMCNGVWQTAG